MQTYTIKEAKKLGDRDEKFGQTWWASVLEVNKPVMFNLMTNDFIGGDTRIEFEVSENKVSNTEKKTEYLRLKKVKVVGGVRQPQLIDEDDRIGIILADVKAIKEHLLGKTEAEVAEEVSDNWDDSEPVDLGDIPF